MTMRVIARTVVYDRGLKKILLIKNKDAEFWCAPGGGWEYENENILECAKREVYEETGMTVQMQRLLYVQEFHVAPQEISFETFWLAFPEQGQLLNEFHTDLDPSGRVEVARWFSREEVQSLQVFPKRLRDTFWDSIDLLMGNEDPFIGVR